jgi:hypothetical protein
MSKQIRVDLWYPRNDAPESVQSVRVSLMDVRAANDLLITYDFDRDGYSISQPSRFRWYEGDDPNDEAPVEVSFVPAWASGEPPA